MASEGCRRLKPHVVFPPCAEATGLPNSGGLREGDGIQAIGSGTSDGDVGRFHGAWTHGFNRKEEEVWTQIGSLPLSVEAKRILGLEGVYPRGAWNSVLVSHDKWMESRGLTPDSWIRRTGSRPQPLSEASMPDWGVEA